MTTTLKLVSTLVNADATIFALITGLFGNSVQ
jgi:hypothetical protein